MPIADFLQAVGSCDGRSEQHADAIDARRGPAEETDQLARPGGPVLRYRHAVPRLDAEMCRAVSIPGCVSAG